MILYTASTIKILSIWRKNMPINSLSVDFIDMIGRITGTKNLIITSDDVRKGKVVSGNVECNERIQGRRPT